MASLNIENWTPNEVSDWIKGLGGQFDGYCESFIDEEITGKALLTINAEYLKELSIENTSDQNGILEAVNCLHEVETCLHGETFHGQVVVVNEKTKILIEQLEKESNEGKVETSESSIQVAGEIYQLAKKLLSWLIRSPFSEMNSCWPLKDSVCRVVRDMTDESLLKNFGYLQENVKKLQGSFDDFLNEKEMHEVFKQPPILQTEEITLEGEGLGIGITTSHNVHTVNSVAPESPAGKNKNIKNGDEIVKVNDQCVIAWQQKSIITLLKSKPDWVSLTLKKLPLVEGPLNKPVDKPGTPLSEMEVIMDRTRITTERTSNRVEPMKEAGIKEETSLEMQAIEEDDLKIEESIEEEPINEEKEEGKEEEGKEAEGKKEEGKKEKEGEEKVDGEKQDEVEKKAEEKEDEEQKEEGKEACETVEDKGIEVKEVTTKAVGEVETLRDEEVKNGRTEISVITEEEAKTELPKLVENLPTGESPEKNTLADETPDKDSTAEDTTAKDTTAEDTLVVSEAANEAAVGDTMAKETLVKETPVVTAVGDTKAEREEAKEIEKKVDEKETIEAVVDTKIEMNDEKPVLTNGKEPSTDKPKKEIIEEKKKVVEQKPEVEESKTVWYDNGETKVEKKETIKDIAKTSPKKTSSSPKTTSPVVVPSEPSPKQNGEAEQSPPTIIVEAIKGSPDKKPPRPERPKMKIGSVKTVTVKGANTKQVEIFSSNVVRREKKVNGAPNKRISCIELGEADCEGWLTKKSGGHGLTPTRWRRQWCVLKEEHMYYYKTSFDREAGGVFEITDYNVSNAAEIKKPFAFKCEKDGAKKYHFHADHEVDREMWVKCLNGAARGEKKQKESLGREMNDGGERKSSVSLKPQNRGRTSSVLAGIRFNYYDDDLQEERVKESSSAAMTAKRVNAGVVGNKERVNDVLKVALAVEENTDSCCEVIPVGELQDKEESLGITEVTGEQKSTSKEPKSSGKMGTVSDSKLLEGTVGVESKSNQHKGGNEEQLITSGVTSDLIEQKGTDEESKSEGTNDTAATVSAVKESTTSVDAESNGNKDGNDGQMGTSAVTSKGQQSCADDVTTHENVGDKNGTEGQLNTSGIKSGTDEQVDTSEIKSGSGKPVLISEVKDTKENLNTSKASEGTSENNGEPKEQLDTCEDKVTPQGTPNDEQKDEFKEIVQSIQEASINIDGTERPSPKEMLRKLSLNSKDEIMDKVVKLRLLKQSLKDKEQSIGVIDELLTSDVTPETITEWRTKFDSVVQQSSNDLNENSQL